MLTPAQVTRSIRLQAAYNFLIDFRFYAPLSILYFAEVTGSFAQAGLIVSILMLSAVVLEVPTGVFSDMLGRKGTLVAGAVALTAAVISFAYADGLGWLLVGACLEGLSQALFSGNNDALLIDTLTEVGRESEFAHLTGRISSALQFGAAIAAISGSIIGALFGLRAAVIASIAPQVIGLAISAFIPAPRRHEIVASPFQHLREAVRLTLTNPKLRDLNLGHIMRTAFGEAGFEFRGVFTQSLWPLWAVGLIRGMNHLGASFSFFFSARLIRRAGDLQVLIFAISFSVICHMLALTLNNPISPLLTTLPSITYGIYTVSVRTLMQREFSPAHRATMGSVGSLGVSLMFAIVSLILGALVDRFGIVTALMVAQLGQFTSIFLFQRAFRPEKIPG